jgi:hypothetical protein
VWCWARRERRREYWWLAAAFGISVLADTATLLWHQPWLVAAIYPVSQLGIVAAVIVSQRQAMAFTGFLMLTGIVALMIEGLDAPGAILPVVGGAVLTTFLLAQPATPLRTALLLAFGVSCLPWIWFVLMPTWASWEAYQGVRAVSLGWFCYAQTESRDG